MKIWEWTCREVYIYDKDPDLCIKKLKQNKEKEYFWIKVSFKQTIYSLVRYWIRDFNEYDYNILKKVQKIIPENSPEYVEITDEWLVESIIKDYNGDVSKNINEYEWKISKDFFIKLEKAIEYLIKNWIEPMDILTNVIIQEYEKWKQKPILFDFKRIWWRTYIFQPWLMVSKKMREQKIYRRINRLKDSF